MFLALLTGHIKDTRRLVVAISLSGSAVSFSLTLKRKKNFFKKNFNCDILNRITEIGIILFKVSQTI